MKREDLSRREFHRLTAAAVGGMMAGGLVGCGGEDENGGNGANGGGAGSGHEAGAPGGHEAAPQGSGTTDSGTSEEGTHDVALLLEEPHVCRGLNTCMGKGKGDNACAGQGSCATAEAHGCHEQNACKGQGGCGEHPGQNACKGQGECAVPLGQDAWTKARAAFENVWSEKNPDKALGEAPAA